MGRFGHWEILIVVLIAALLFGSKRLPELGRSLGKGLANFKASVKENDLVADEDRPAENKLEEK